MNPIVSIVIPVYNTALYLDECMQSLLDQTYPKDSMEIIAINDGSTDGSLDILKSYEEKFPTFQIIDQENKGPGAARNVGIDLASGKYIYFLDSDDRIAPNLVTDCVKAIEKDFLEVCFFQKYVFDDPDYSDKKPVPVLYQTKNQKFGIQTGMDFFRIQIDVDENCAAVWQYFYRTSFLRKHNLYFPENMLHEDEPFTVRLLLLAERFANLEKAFYFRRVRPGSIMTATNRLKRAEHYQHVLKVMNSYFSALNSNQTILLSRYMVVILRNILKLYRFNELWKNRSLLWKAAKMTNDRHVYKVPDCLGGLYMYTFCTYRAARKFIGKKLSRLGSRLDNI